MNRNNQGMTLLEILIVFALVAALIVGTLALINPREQVNKSYDARRKNELNELRKIFESWYSDKGCYPKMSDVCFNTVTSTTCEICTSNPASPSLSSYTSSVICDPMSPLKNYLYQIAGDPNCPGAFVVYTPLSAAYNSSEDLWHCGPVHGCGLGPDYGYDYLVTSPNASVSYSSNYYCLSNQNRCSSCGTLESCVSAQQRDACGNLYASKTLCCQANPSAGYCP